MTTRIRRLLAVTLLCLAPACAGQPAQPQDTSAIAVQATRIAPHASPAVRGDAAELRRVLAARRDAAIAELAAYAARGVFPLNQERPGRLNVFIDGTGAICAAANLIAASGQRALVDATAADDNFLRLADVTDGPLMDWMLTSGLTQDEIAIVQEPYAFVGEQPSPAVLATEVGRLREHFAAVDETLRHQRDASLDRAVARLGSRPDLRAALLGT